MSCRDEVTGTVPGPVALTRAWYHGAACKYGLARDAGPGVEEASLSPGLRAMNDRAAAAGPFAKAVRLLEITLRCQQASRPEDLIWLPDITRLTGRTAKRS